MFAVKIKELSLRDKEIKRLKQTIINKRQQDGRISPVAVVINAEYIGHDNLIIPNSPHFESQK